MEQTPSGTSVGVDDPYAHAGICDHLTSDGQCRFAFSHADKDPQFARERRKESFVCPFVDGEGESRWQDCPHYQSRSTVRECIRCGLEERKVLTSSSHGQNKPRPLLEEHHLSYANPETLNHEITIFLCRWCHAKVHNSWARVTDDANPDPEALAELEARRSRELEELEFHSAATRYER